MVGIKNSGDWQAQIIRQLEHYKKKAPFYRETIAWLKDVLVLDCKTIGDLNTHCLRRTCEYLGIRFNFTLCSSMLPPLEQVNAPDEWSLQIAKRLGATTYINPPGGVHLFDRSKFEREGIVLKFLRLRQTEYDQGRGPFEPALSVLDAMMFNAPAAILKMLDEIDYLVP